MALRLKFLASAAGVAAAQNANWVKYNVDLQAFPLALCLDGSPGAFYVSPGSGPNASKWVFHLQGGGYCFDPITCAARAAGQDAYNGQPSLGSSAKWASQGCPTPNGTLAPMCVADGGDTGALSADPAVNPLFASYTKVWFGYCDGTSFAGAIEAPVVINATTTIYVRGRYIIDAIVETLLINHGLAGAAELVIKGCSAGGIAVFLHAQRIAGAMWAANPRTHITAMPGAGTLLRIPSYNGTYLMDGQIASLWSWAKMKGSANDVCLQQYAATPWYCFYPQFNLPFWDATSPRPIPMFVVNSMADLAQYGAFMGLPCTPTAAQGNPAACNASEFAYLNAFRSAMISAITDPVLSNPIHGAWLVECFVHVLENNNGAWANITIGPAGMGGQGMRDTVAQWYAQSFAIARTHGRARALRGDQERAVDLSVPFPSYNTKVLDGPWGSNPTCGAYSP